MTLTPGRRDHRFIEEKAHKSETAPPAGEPPGPPPWFRATCRRTAGGAAPGPDGEPWNRRWHGGPPHHRYRATGGGAPFGDHLPWWRIQRQRGRLRRATEGRMLGGVAEGIGRRVGIDPTVVRIGFVILTLTGFGLPVYMLAWLLLPADNAERNIASAAVLDRRGLMLVVALLPLAVAALVLSSALRGTWMTGLIWPTFIAGGALVLIWRNAPGDERAVLERAARPVLAVGSPGRSWPQILLWAAVGLGAIGGGLALLLHHRSAAALFPIGGVLLVLAGLVVVFGPWWLRVARDLVVERQARARAEERADMAARVHDSVLQTLALIQRRADQPSQVVGLARAQERELRSWLFEGRAPGSLGAEATTFAEGVACIQRDVEASHDIRVEAVTVGDSPIDDGVSALLEATREAAVNAAKWSGAPTVSVFAEVGDRGVSVFVRDRGAGFSPGEVPEDRRGLAESILGRMGRHGGTAKIRSAPGEGTEVSLELPLARRERDRRERNGTSP